jgi:hypothetical protein
LIYLLLAPAALGASWSAPRTIQDSKTSFPHPFSVAAGADGTLAVIFRHRGDFPTKATVHVAVRRHGRWLATRTVSAPRGGAAQPRVAVDRSGRVLAVWVRPTRVRGNTNFGPYLVEARMTDSRGRWGRIVTVGKSAHFFESSPGIAFDARGDATVVWRGYRRVGRHPVDTIQAAYRPAGGRFRSARSVPSTSRVGRLEPVVAMSPSGRAYLAWTVGTQQPFIQAAQRLKNGSWSAPRRISPAPASKPQIAVASDGSVVVAWREASIDTEGNGIQRGGVGARIATSDFIFGEVQHVADARTSSLQLVATPAGETLVAWSDSDEAAGNLRYAVRASGGAFAAPADVPGGHPGVVTTLADGTAIAFWGRDGIHAATRPPHGDFGAPETIAPTGIFPAAAGGAVVWLDGELLKIATRS